jgi:hypothetical protein
VARVKNYTNKDAATSSVLKHRAGEAVVVRRTVPPVLTCKGTSLLVADRVRMAGIAGGGVVPMTDQVQGFGAGRGVVVPGIPPRGRPVRC